MKLTYRIWRLSLPLVLLAALAAACGGNSPESEEWEAVFLELPGALTSVWGTSPTDVWAVGADAGPEFGATVLHYDGSQWQRLQTGFSGDLWWVFGFSGGPVFMGGSQGAILKYENGGFEKMDTPGAPTVYGIWGVAPDNVWAVGGNVSAGAFAWHYDGVVWAEVPGFPQNVFESDSLFKLYGRNATDMWMIGTNGVALHYDGSTFTQAPAGTARNLFTVHADAGLYAAVGGFGSGVIVENDGGGWKDVTPDGAPQVIGIYLTGTGQGYAVGVEGSVLRRDGNRWKIVDTGLTIDGAFHSVWVDPSGGVWAVGGQVLAPPLIDGVMVYKRP
ncbi:MAG: hypothetical protein FJ317_07845 [SAR202 cluster bacterium]|nr:hypothetical protein [SAR202 cluster bacterium]